MVIELSGVIWAEIDLKSQVWFQTKISSSSSSKLFKLG